MKTFVVILVQIETAWVQYAGNNEEEARDVTKFEDYATFVDCNSGRDDDNAYFKMHVWEDGKGVYNEFFYAYTNKWRRTDSYDNM